MHGSMRRREATPDQSANAARCPEASRRPYEGAARWPASLRPRAGAPPSWSCGTPLGASRTGVTARARAQELGAPLLLPDAVA
jgi:hypothetical protein